MQRYIERKKIKRKENERGGRGRKEVLGNEKKEGKEKRKKVEKGSPGKRRQRRERKRGRRNEMHGKGRKKT